MADVTKPIECSGPAAFAGALVQCLKDEGVEVHWEPPEEERGVPDRAAEAVVAIVAAGAYDAIKVGVRKFRERFRQGRVEIEDEDN